MLIADKQGIEAGAMCRRRSLDHPARPLARVFGVRVIACERDPDFHHIVPCCRLKVSIQAKLKRAGVYRLAPKAT